MVDVASNQGNLGLAGAGGLAQGYESSSSYSSTTANYGAQGGLGNANYGAAGLTGAGNYGAAGLTGAGNYGAAGLGGSGYEASSYSSEANYGTTGLAGSAGYGSAGYGATGYGASGYGASGYGATGLGGSGYEASSYSSEANYGSTGLAGSAGYGSAGYGSAGYGGAGYGSAGGYNASSSAVQSYATDAQGLFQDSNPQVIRRPAPGGNVTYTQNIRVRFLQPPPVPPPGPLIIKEVRPPQPPVPAPLRIRQQAPALPQPPPLVLRERPPQPPATVASQTVIRRLAAIPVPPRTVIIERLPAAPPRPRDIIIERWVPYGAAAKRRTVVQRAAAAQQYQAPRNVIVQYETPQVRIARQFQKLGVTPANPQAYLQQYGAQLLDSVTLVQQARAAGVVEDISPPVYPGSFAATEGQFSSTGGAAGAGGLTGSGAGGILGEINYEATAGGVGSRYNQGYSGYSAYQSGGGVLGLESPAAASAHVGGPGEGPTGYGATPFLSSAYGAAGGEAVATYGVGATSGPGTAFAPNALFNAADTNQDHVLSQQEFNAAGY